MVNFHVDKTGQKRHLAFSQGISMKRISNFLHSDGVDRYGNYFPVRLFADALRHHSRTGLPQCIGHDLHRPIGWVFPFGVYFHPKVARLVGDCWICETESDFEDIRKAHTQAHLKRQAELTEDYYEDLCLMLVIELA